MSSRAGLIGKSLDNHQLGEEHKALWEALLPRWGKYASKGEIYPIPVMETKHQRQNATIKEMILWKLLM